MSGAALAPGHWLRIEELFQASIDLPEDQRHAFLREACGTDDQLRAEVESLLASDSRESPLIAGIVDDATNSLFDDDCPEGSVLE